MKEYFEGLMKSAKKVADALVVKTSETVDAAKLEVEMRKVQSALDKEYKALGQIVFQVEKGVMTRDEHVIATACNRIQEKIDHLAELQAQKEINKEEPASAASTVQEADMPQESEEEDEEEIPMPERGEDGYFVLKFCPECKVGNHPDAVRCVNCGAEFPKQEAKE